MAELLEQALDKEGLSRYTEKVKKALAGKQDAITGQQGQVVGFDAKGKPVAQSTASLVGPAGKDGTDGRDGVSVTHQWNGSTLTVTSASGASSADLRGPTGATGATGAMGPAGKDGAVGAKGKTAYQYAKDGGYTGTEAEFAKLMNMPPITSEMHRIWFRGKHLGASVTAAQKAAVQTGTFDNLFLGDYWTINGINWRIVDMDYWLHCGPQEFTSHHLVIMPDTILYSARMNSSNTTAGGYAGSEMRSTNLAQAKTIVTNAFGAILLLQHSELLTTGTLNGSPSNVEWFNSLFDIPNEIMMYGSQILGSANVGTNNAYNHVNSRSQLALFQIAPKFIIAGGETGARKSFWLRDIQSDQNFACVNEEGHSDFRYASTAHGVRPIFAIG